MAYMLNVPPQDLVGDATDDCEARKLTLSEGIYR